jgi:ubiquitin-activating enzyme E1
MCDLSGNFFLSEDDIGENRAVACVAKLQELNNAVLIHTLTEELTTEHLSKFQVCWFSASTVLIFFTSHCCLHSGSVFMCMR